MAGMNDFLRGLFAGPPQAQPPMNAPQGMLGGLQQWNTDNPGVLSAIGAGMMSGNMGAGLEQAGKFRALAVADQKNRAEATRTNDLTRKWLLGRGISEADADAALANPAILQSLMKGPDTTSGIQEYEYAKANGYKGSFVDYQNSGGSAAQVPTSIQEFQMSQKDPAYAEFMKTGKGRDSTLTAGDRTRISEAEDAAMGSQNTIDMLQRVITPDETGTSLNDRAGSGWTAGTQSVLARNDPTGFFDDKKGEATTELENVVLGQALQSLKSIFGAAPTEGERKILVDLQASTDKTPREREIIIKNAVELAKKRLAFNMDRASELRGGTYYNPGGGYNPGGAPAQGGSGTGARTTKSGVSYTVNP